MTTDRRHKIASLLHRESAEVFRLLYAENPAQNLITVTRVRLGSDFSHARVYLSIFPSANARAAIDEVHDKRPQIKHRVAQRVKSRLRKMPDLSFHLDDSLDYVEAVDRALEGKNNPLKER
ncbi:MAG: 30S ribosome-binding factor RbfA [Flavobacteriales bacterium]